jgi:hypothetical protein
MLKFFRIILIFIALAVLIQRVAVLSMPMIEMGGMEINVLYGILRVLHGEPLYQNAAAFPFSVMQYPPLHYFLVAKTAAFFDENTSLEDLYIWNRAFSLAFNVFLGLLVFYILQQKKLQKLDAGAWASVLFVAATMPFYNRMDALYWLLFLVFVQINKYLFVQKNGIALCLSAVFAALLCLCKQTAYGLIILHLLYFIPFMAWRKTVIWLGLVAIFYSIGFLMMVENLNFFYQNTMLGLVCKILFWETLAQFLTNKHFFVLLPLLFATLFCAYNYFRLRQYYDLLLLAYVTAFALFGILKEASDVHYFAETTLLTCMGLAIFFNKNDFIRQKIVLLFCIMPLFLVKIGSVFYKIHGSHFIHNEADLIANEKAAAAYLQPRLHDSIFAHVFYTSTIPAHLQTGIVTPQPDVFSAVSDQNPHILNAVLAFERYKKPDFCVIRNDETIQSIHNCLGIAFPMDYRRDTVFGKVEIWHRKCAEIGIDSEVSCHRLR